jgi:hypothetical protein
MMGLIIFSHLGTLLPVTQQPPESLPSGDGMGQTRKAPWLAKDFERLIVCGNEWLQSLASHPGM